MATQRSFFEDALHVCVLFAFAVVQPLLDLVSHNATFLVYHRSGPGEMILLLALLCFALPLSIVLVEFLTGMIGPNVREGAHSFFVFLLVFLIALPILKRIPVTQGWFPLLGAAVLAAVVTLTYARFRGVSLFLTVLSPAILLFPAVFLLRPQVRTILAAPPQQEEARAPTHAEDNAAQTPVVFILLDELPLVSLVDEQYQIDASLYPNFAAFAERATWYRNATTVHEATEAVITAVLTGRLIEEIQPPTLANYPQNLFALLQHSHELHIFEDVSQLAPVKAATRGVTQHAPAGFSRLIQDLAVVYLHVLLPRNLTARLPSVTDTWGDFWQADPVANRAPPETTASQTQAVPTDRRAALFAEFLDSLAPGERPGLHFIHLVLPHMPWRYLPSGKVYSARRQWRRHPGEVWLTDEWLVLQSYQRHLLQLGYVDRLMGQLVQRLREGELFDSSLIIITADHGTSFWQGDSRRDPLQTGHQDDILRVPLFVKLPHQKVGSQSDRNAELIDIVPTVADLLEIELPWQADGQSMVDPSIPERRHKVLFSRSGERLEFEPGFHPDERSLARKLALFDPADGEDRLYKVGPYGELLGRDVEELPVARNETLEAEIDQAAALDDYDRELPWVPVFLSGRIRSAQAATVLDLAIALNDRIAAVTRTSEPLDGEAEFAALVPESAIVSGDNRVEVFVIDGAPQSPRLIAGLSRTP